MPHLRVALVKVQRGVQTWRPLPTWRQGARWRGRTWRQNVASLAHVRREQDVASKCGVTCPCGVREPGGVAGRGVKTWAWRQGARWRRRTWRQNVASLPHAAPGTQVVSPDVASKCGVAGPRGVREPGGVAGRGVKVASLAHVASGSQVASQDVASKCGVTCLRGVREPGGVAGRGVKMWRHLPAWRQGATCGRRSSARAHARPRLASQNVASKCGVTCPRGVRELRGVARRGVKTWRQAPSIYVRHWTWRQNVASRSQASRHVSSKCVFSRRAICAPPQATTLFHIKGGHGEETAVSHGHAGSTGSAE